jgi:FkbM family methyltransferase
MPLRQWPAKIAFSNAARLVIIRRNSKTRKEMFTESARRFYRTYRNGRFRVGHSLFKRFFRVWLRQEQEVCLRSGLRLRLDLSKPNQAGIFWYDGDADVPLEWAIRELLPPGGLFIDCGANCGLMGLLACQHRSARVIFIEPHPRLAKSIEANIRLNRFEKRAELVEAAISNVSGHVTFYENSTGDDGTHSIHQDWGEGEKRVIANVRCQTLKEIIEQRQLSHIDFLKIDTEGNDLAVLQGMEDYLRPAFTKLIYVEMARDGESICQLMTSRGYAGFSTPAARGRELVRLQQIYGRGGRVSFFGPLGAHAGTAQNALWCGRESAVAIHLQELSPSAPANG